MARGSAMASAAAAKRGSFLSRMAPCQKPRSPAGTKMSRVRRRKSSGSPMVLVRIQATLGCEVPAVEHGQSQADILQGHGQIDGVLGHFGHGPAAGDPDKMVILEADLLGRILQSGGDENGPDTGQQSPLGGPGGPVGGADGHEGGGGQDEGSGRRGQGGGDAPIVHWGEFRDVGDRRRGPGRTVFPCRRRPPDGSGR